MKTTKDKANKDFDTVKFFRKVKEKVSKETRGMTFEQFKQYLKMNALAQTK